MNHKNLVGIKTPFGMTERVNISNITQQGGIWGPTTCSNSIDSTGRKCEERKEYPLKYKSIVNILPLTYIDDKAGIAKCGDDSVKLNILLTTQIESKRLKFNEGHSTRKGKCFRMHVGRDEKQCKVLKVHDKLITEVKELTYLGDMVTSDGKTRRT